MEVMRQPYESIMSMPCGRRKRFIEEKDHLETVKAARAPKGRRTGRRRG